MTRQAIIIAGAGIAGLAAAIALAARGFSCSIFERSEKLEEVGAGLQLSPNATRLLDRLGVLDLLRPHAVQPKAVLLRKAGTFGQLARVPLGEDAERRWGAPYLVAHRADLQNALLEKVAQEPSIQLTAGAEIRAALPIETGVQVSIDVNGASRTLDGLLLIGADGVWSKTRTLVAPSAKSRFAGEVAWRTTIASDSPGGRMLREIGANTVVTAFLHPGAHLIVYPVRAGTAFNLVAFTPGERIADGWSGNADIAILLKALRGVAELSQLVQAAGAWTVWPIHTIDPTGPWTRDGAVALIGDAAHAMTPFAAQGAAMAIEDAVTLAGAVSGSPTSLAGALAQWEAKRRPRVQRVARRGALNRFAWHAGGPVALARDLFLKTRSPEGLAADMDWLYGWEPDA
jgi:salicylate hydroxylase